MSEELDFPYTCSAIDSAIDDVEQDVNTLVEEFIDEYLDLISKPYSSNELENFKKAQTNNFMQSFKGPMEDIRTTNSDMRDAANNQLTDLQEEHDAVVKDFEDEIESLEMNISTLENRLEVNK